MTLQAEQIYLTHPQEARIGGSVRCVTGTAAFGFDWNMLEHERSLLVGVAFVTSCVAARKSLHLAQGCGPVYVMAVTTLDQSFVDAVMVRLCEVCFLRNVTAVTKRWLGPHKQMLLFLGVVRRMAVETSHIVIGVHGTRKMPLLRIVTMTAQATLVHFVFGKGREPDDLTDVAPGLHVLGAWTVARLTAVPALERSFEVRRRFEVLFIEIFVARLAHIDPNILSRRFAWNSSKILLGLSGWPRLNYQNQQC